MAVVFQGLFSFVLLGLDLVEMFTCEHSTQKIHYTLVCDFRQDCSDASDENFCEHTVCSDSEETCYSGQCVTQDQICDDMRHCIDGTDEKCTQVNFTCHDLNTRNVKEE